MVTWVIKKMNKQSYYSPRNHKLRAKIFGKGHRLVDTTKIVQIIVLGSKLAQTKVAKGFK